MKRKQTLADIVLLILCFGSLSVKAQNNRIDLLDDPNCYILFNTNYEPIVFDSEGNPALYGWVTKGSDGTRHKIITTANTGGNDPHVPSISELPAGASKCLRLGTFEYQKIDFGKSGGVIYQYRVTEENAIMYINYAAKLTDSQEDHIKVLESKMGQYLGPLQTNYGPIDCWLNAYSTYEYDTDWEYQQPLIEFYLAVDGDTTGLSCYHKYQALYQPNGSPTELKNTWKSKIFEVQDKDNPSIKHYFNGYYKDWTLMAVDFTPFIGHTIAFIAQYYDCAQAGWLYPVDVYNNVYEANAYLYTCDDHHFANLYLSVTCSPNGDGVNIPSAITVDNVDCQNNQVTCSAPEGFISYKWYSSNNPYQTLSDSHTCTYTFASGETDLTLYCDVTSALTSTCANKVTTFSIPIQNNCPCEAEFTFPRYVCADDGALRIQYEYTSGAPLSYNIVFDETAKGNGFSDKFEQPITDPTEIAVPMPASVRPNLHYSYILTVHQSNGRDTVIWQPLEVRYPSKIIVQRWNDVLALYNQSYNGQYSFSSIEWYQDSVPAYSATIPPYNSYIYQPGGLQGTEYWAALTRVGESEAICTCPFRPELKPEYNTPAPQRIQLAADNADTRTVRVDTDLSGIYTLYTIDGKMLRQGRFGPDYGSPVIQLPAAGVYIIRFDDNGQGAETKKWIAE